MTDHDATPGDPRLADTEDQLTRALHARAAGIEPTPTGLDRIEEKLMSQPRTTTAQRWILGGVAGVAAVLVVVALIASSLSDGDDDVTTAASSSTTTEAPTSTEAPSSTTTTTSFAAPVDAFAVAFPSPEDSRRFDDPTAAARAYATDVLGFTELAVEPATASTSGSATVTVRSRSGEPATTVSLEQQDDDSWFVLGSNAPDIEVDQPAVGASLATPFETTGTALAFEGTVDVVVLAQGRPGPLGTGFVMGSGVPPAAPFDGRIFFSPPRDATPGVLVYRTLSPEDGRVVQATSFPVRLTNNTLPTPPDECGDTADDGAEDPDARIVKVYFHCGVQDLDEVVALRRSVPAGEPAILTRTLEALLMGPTASERDAGFTSPFPVEGGELLGVIIDGGVAEVDLSAAVANLPNASATILTLRAELFRTATQFSSVAAVEVLFDGSCEAFAEWSQSDSCLITAE